MYIVTACILISVLCFKKWVRLCLILHKEVVSGLIIMGQVLITSSFDRQLRCFDLQVNQDIRTRLILLKA